MPKTEESYKNRKIVAEETDQRCTLTIDGTSISVTKENDVYHSPAFAHQEFGSLLELARAVVDSRKGAKS